MTSSEWCCCPTASDPGGTFIIVQSHARIPIERVRDYCLSFAS